MRREDALPPLSLLRSLHDALGEYMLIGSYARDYICSYEAELEPNRSTEDVDVAVVVPGPNDVQALLERLPRGPGNDRITRRRVDGWRVDILPAIEGVGEFEKEPSVVDDLTGQFEAYATSRSLDLGDGLMIRVPTLQAMVVLKVVAWNMRGRSTAKDAQDLEQLFRAAPTWGRDEDAVYTSSAFEKYGDFDEALCHMTGEDARRDLPVAALRVGDVLQGRLHELAGAMHRERGSFQQERAREQLTALLAGLRNQSGGSPGR